MIASIGDSDLGLMKAGLNSITKGSGLYLTVGYSETGSSGWFQSSGGYAACQL
jgi:hypothetical protein